MCLTHFTAPQMGQVILQKGSKPRGAGARAHRWSGRGRAARMSPALPTPYLQHTFLARPVAHFS